MHAPQALLFKRFLYLLPAIVFPVAMVGCQKPAIRPSSPSSLEANADTQTYANAHKVIMVDFSSRLKQLSSRPLPQPPKDATKRERREVLAKALDALTVAAQSALIRLDRLTPPSSMREIHNKTRVFFVTYRDTNAACVDAMRRGNRKEFDRLSAKHESAIKSTFAQLRAAVMASLIREGKTPQEAEAITRNLVI